MAEDGSTSPTRAQDVLASAAAAISSEEHAASRSLLSASSFVAVALGLQVVSRAVSLIVLARVLGPAGQGTVALSGLIATVGAVLAALGLDVALMRSAALRETREAARAAVWTQTLIVIAASIAVLVVLELAASPSNAVEVGIAAVPGLLFSRLAAACALGEGRVAEFGLLTVVPWATSAATLLALAAADELTTGRALVTFVASAAICAALFALVLRSWLRPTFASRFWTSDPYRVGIRVFPGLLAQLGNYRLDQAVIAVWLSKADLGLYSLAVAASEAAMLPAQATANAVVPHASRAHTHTGRFLKAAFVSSLLVLLAVPPFVLLVEFWLPAYEDALVPFLLLLPGTIALAGSKVLAAVLVGRGEAWKASQVAFVTLGVTLCATVTLIPAFGLAGAAIAASVAYCVSASLLLRASIRPSSPASGTSPILGGPGVGLDRG